jgi:hypothetical protein
MDHVEGLQCEDAISLVHPEETTLQIVPIHEDCVVVEALIVFTIFADELLEYPPNDEVMKLGQAEGQRLQWRRCQIDIKGAPTCKSRSHVMVQIPCSSHNMVHIPSSHGSPHPPPPPQSPHQQRKKLVENKISTPRTTGKKSLEKPSAISKLQE